MPTTDQNIDCSRYRVLVERIAASDQQAEQELYELLSRGVRFLMLRHLRRTDDVEDELHNVFVIVFSAIQTGRLREPERLMGFVRGVVRHRLAQKIEEIVKSRSTVEASDFNVGGTHCDIEARIADEEQKKIARDVLQGMPVKDREILVRFYLSEQTPEEICRDMHLSATQFRLLKSRAKARFVERSKKREKRRFGMAKVVALPRRTRVA